LLLFKYFLGFFCKSADNADVAAKKSLLIS